MVNLTNLRHSLIEKFEKHDQDEDKMKSAMKELSGIQKLETKFKSKIFDYMRNHAEISMKDPGLLIKVLRILEYDQKVWEARREKYRDSVFSQENE